MQEGHFQRHKSQLGAQLYLWTQPSVLEIQLQEEIELLPSWSGTCWLLSPAWFTITEEPPPSASLAWRDYISNHHFMNLWSLHYVLVENPIKKCLSSSFPFSFPELPFTSVFIFSFWNFSGMILSHLLSFCLSGQARTSVQVMHPTTATIP